MWNFHFIEHRDDLGSFCVVQFSVKEGEIDPAGPKSQAEQGNDHHPGSEHDADALIDAELLPDGQELPAKQREGALHELDLHPHQFLVRVQ